MTKVNLCRRAALGALLSLGGCASYQASSVASPVSPASSAVRPSTPENAESAAPPETTLKPRVGVQKPSDDTRINSGAGDAEPMHDGLRRD
jgi:hypothetical protein